MNASMSTAVLAPQLHACLRRATFSFSPHTWTSILPSGDAASVLAFLTFVRECGEDAAAVVSVADDTHKDSILLLAARTGSAELVATFLPPCKRRKPLEDVPWEFISAAVLAGTCDAAAASVLRLLHGAGYVSRSISAERRRIAAEADGSQCMTRATIACARAGLTRCVQFMLGVDQFATCFDGVSETLDNTLLEHAAVSGSPSTIAAVLQASRTSPLVTPAVRIVSFAWSAACSTLFATPSVGPESIIACQALLLDEIVDAAPFFSVICAPLTMSIAAPARLSCAFRSPPRTRMLAAICALYRAYPSPVRAIMEEASLLHVSVCGRPRDGFFAQDVRHHTETAPVSMLPLRMLRFDEHVAVGERGCVYLPDPYRAAGNVAETVKFVVAVDVLNWILPSQLFPIGRHSVKPSSTVLLACATTLHEMQIDGSGGASETLMQWAFTRRVHALHFRWRWLRRASVRRV